MRPRLLPPLLRGFAPLAAGVLLWSVPAARGQVFDAEREALEPRTRIEFTLSSLAADSSTEVSGVTTDRSSSRHEGAGAFAGLAAGPFFAGAGGQRSLFNEETPQFEIRVKREAAGAAAALRLGPVAAVLSTSRAVFDSLVEDTPSGAGIDFRVDLVTDAGLGLFLNLGPLRLGYSRSRDRLALEFEESSQSSVEEHYAFESEAYHGAFFLGGEKGIQLSGGLKRTQAPLTRGDRVDYGGSDEETRFGSIGYAFDAKNRVYVSLTTSDSEARFKDLLEIETQEQSASFGLELESGLSMSLAQSLQRSTQAFSPSAGLQEVSSKLRSISARIGWRF